MNGVTSASERQEGVNSFDCVIIELAGLMRNGDIVFKIVQEFSASTTA
jgi:hypothetical protein